MKKKAISAGSAMIQQVLFFLLLLLIIIVAVYGFMENPRPGGLLKQRAQRFSKNTAQIICPAGWNGKSGNNDFLFFNQKKSGVIYFHAEQSPHYFFAAIDMNPQVLQQKVKEILTQAKIKFDACNVANLRHQNPYRDFATLRFTFTAGQHEGMGMVFYSHDVKYTYLGTWLDEDRKAERYAVACPDYIELPEPYNVQLYQRPVTNTRQMVKLAKYLDEAKKRVKEAFSLEDSAMVDPTSLQRAMKSLELALKKLAVANTHAAGIENQQRLISLYQKCSRERIAQINHMKSRILQSRAMGNTTQAKELAKELIAMASLDNEMKVKAWAEQQFQQLD